MMSAEELDDMSVAIPSLGAGCKHKIVSVGAYMHISQTKH